MYVNPAANSYQSILVALYQMSVTLPGSSRDVPVNINTSNKTATIDLIRRVQLVTLYFETTEVQGVMMTYVKYHPYFCYHNVKMLLVLNFHF